MSLSNTGENYLYFTDLTKGLHSNPYLGKRCPTMNQIAIYDFHHGRSFTSQKSVFQNHLTALCYIWITVHMYVQCQLRSWNSQNCRTDDIGSSWNFYIGLLHFKFQLITPISICFLSLKQFSLLFYENWKKNIYKKPQPPHTPTHTHTVI